ncbi:MAG: YetF domain-containing protein [Balneolaceae bacterium]
MENIFFDSWESIGRTFFITITAYLSMVFLLRSSGKRTLSKMNAFDFIITVGLGSSLATVALNKNVPLIEGLMVFFLLIYLQFSITWLSVRTNKVKKAVTSQPTLLQYKGELLEDTLKRERITLEEIHLIARRKGFNELNKIDAIVLETTGDITVIPKMPNTEVESMRFVEIPHK